MENLGRHMYLAIVCSLHALPEKKSSRQEHEIVSQQANCPDNSKPNNVRNKRLCSALKRTTALLYDPALESGDTSVVTCN